MLPTEEPVKDATRAVIIEGLPLVRAGMSSVLREQHVAVVAEASTSADACSLVKGSDAHLLMVGNSGDGASIAAAITRVKARNPDVAVVALVPRCTRDDILAILDAGADALVPHDAEREELVTALDAVRAGGRHLSPALTAALFAGATSSSAPGEERETGPTDGVLTTRERSIVRLLAEGRTNEQIGANLFIAAATVKTHLSHVYEKLGARNRYDAVVKATQHGLL
jgi:DNA-binding NarL/FixJ family response regulator